MFWRAIPNASHVVGHQTFVPGYQWPRVLIPLYRLAEHLPATREGARHIGLVTIDQMTNALVHAVESPVQGIEIMDVPAVRASTVVTALRS